MRAVGVIVEYNPFHNGHAFHLQASREAAQADVVIAVMSGNFLQRGEPALVSKWQRTKMALLNGVDIVFELPYRFATQNAETFANGAVSILAAAGCQYLCFGSESGEIEAFQQTIHFLESQQDSHKKNIKHFMGSGVSYPKALALSYKQLSNSDNYLDLSRPNNILGFHYIKAIHEQRSQITPLTVARKNADYHDEHFASETIASATSIRKALFADINSPSEINQYVPEPTRQLLHEYLNQYGLYHRWENYWPFLQLRLLHSSPEELKEIYEAEEGLENRLQHAATEARSFQEFMERIKTKRYTWTRLQRLCVHILTNSKKINMEGSKRAGYLRLLGMSERGQVYLNKMKKEFALPLVAKLSSFKDEEINLDLKAARVYAMGVPGPAKNFLMEQEFKQPPIIIKK